MACVWGFLMWVWSIVEKSCELEERRTLLASHPGSLPSSLAWVKTLHSFSRGNGRKSKWRRDEGTKGKNCSLVASTGFFFAPSFFIYSSIEFCAELSKSRRGGLERVSSCYYHLNHIAFGSPGLQKWHNYGGVQSEDIQSEDIQNPKAQNMKAQQLDDHLVCLA